MSELDSIVIAPSRRDFPGFLGYQADTGGDIWSCWNAKHGLTDTWRRLRGSVLTIPSGMKYRVYFPVRDRKQTTIRGHQIVALAFLGPPPLGMEIRHLNGDGLDNRLENLVYGTKRENNADRDLHGTMLRGEASPVAKVSDAAVSEIRELAAGGMTIRELSERYPLSESHIGSIIRGRWRRLPAYSTK